MWYIRVWIGPHSLPPGAMIGRCGVTGFITGGGLREPHYTTLGWAVMLPGVDESPYADVDAAGRLSLRTAALVRLAAIAQEGRYYSATWIFAEDLDDVMGRERMAIAR